MSGIVGISSNENSREKIYDLLHCLQHRGNQLYGYSSSSKCEYYNGLIDKSSENNSKELIGFTTFYQNGIYSFGNMSIASDCDDVLDVKFFRESKLDIKETIRNYINTYNNRFFMILLIEDHIYAFKDRYGSKPGCYGFDGNNMIISSENLGFEITDNIKPGEILHYHNGEITRDIQDNVLIPNVFEYIYFANKDSSIYERKVLDFRFNLAEKAVKLVEGHVNVVCGIGEKSRLYGLEISSILKVPYIEPIVKREFRSKFIRYTSEFEFLDFHFKFGSVLLISTFVSSGQTVKYFYDTFRSKNCEAHCLSITPKGKVPYEFRFETNTLDENYPVTYNTEENIKSCLGFERINY